MIPRQVSRPPHTPLASIKGGKNRGELTPIFPRAGAGSAYKVGPTPVNALTPSTAQCLGLTPTESTPRRLLQATDGQKQETSFVQLTALAVGRGATPAFSW
jgi:hypothetical protein